MRGFETKALILFPKMENFEHRGADYKFAFKQVIEKLLNYLDSVGMEAHVFYTDDVARYLRNERFHWVSPLSKADRFFVLNHCADCSDAMSLPMVEFDKIYNDVLAKDPGSLDMSEDERFEMVLRHTAKATSKIIPTYKVVIHFQLPNKQQYKVTTKPGDGKIRININFNNFIPTVYMGGVVEDACDLLGVPYGNRSLEVWEC